MSSPTNNTHMFSLVYLPMTKKEAFLHDAFSAFLDQMTLHQHGCFYLVQVCRPSVFSLPLSQDDARRSAPPFGLQRLATRRTFTAPPSSVCSDTAALPLPSRNICPLSSSSASYDPPILLPSYTSARIRKGKLERASFAVLPCPRPPLCPA